MAGVLAESEKGLTFLESYYGATRDLDALPREIWLTHDVTVTEVWKRDQDGNHFSDRSIEITQKPDSGKVHSSSTSQHLQSEF